MRMALSNGAHRVGAPHFDMRAETDPLSDILCFLEYRAMDEAQELSNLEC
jgi:hypothetical protein